MANNVKKVWASGKAAVNGWLAIPAGLSAEMIAQCGFDSVTVDMQHGVQDYQSMVQCFQAMHAHPVTPMVRVPWNEPGMIGKVLDAGAYGVICPMINTRQEAENFVAYCKYPPRGTRSNGPIRAGMYGSAGTYQETANAETLCIPGGGSKYPQSEEVLKRKLNKVAMQGREVYRYAVRALPEVVLEALAANGMTTDSVDHIIAHQANLRIIESVMERLGIPLEKIFLNIARYGNTSSASLPITLDEANRAGRLHEGDIIAMMSIGAGMAWGSALVRW